MSLLDRFRPAHQRVASQYPTTTYAAADPPTATLGVDDQWLGLQLYLSGGPDINPELTGQFKYPVYDEMRKTNPAVKSTLWMLKQPIRAAEWTIDPAPNAAPEDELIADAARWQFGLAKDDIAGPLDKSWSRVLGQKLLMLDWGAMFEELLWSDDLVAWRDANGDEHQLRPIVRLAPRMPHTVHEVRVDPKTGLESIQQWLPGAKPIPAEKLAVHVLDQEGSDYFGTSMLRAMYGPWLLQKTLMVAVGIGWDRFAAGIPVVRYPADDAQAKTRAAKIGRDARVGERFYVTLPGADMAHGGQWDFDVKQVAATGMDPVPLLRWYSEQIAIAGLQHFSNLGTSQTGSRAVGQVLIEPFYFACQAFAGEIAEEMQRRELRRFVDYNFGAQFDTPRLKAAKVQQVSPAVMSQVLDFLAAAGLSFTDLETQNYIRDITGLPLLEHDPVAGDAAPPGEGDALPRSQVPAGPGPTGPGL